LRVSKLTLVVEAGKLGRGGTILRGLAHPIAKVIDSTVKVIESTIRRIESDIIKSDASPSANRACTFRAWKYAIAKARFAEEAALEEICIDSGCTMSIIDHQFLKSVLPNATPTTVATVPIRGIGKTVQECDQHVTFTLYLPGQNATAAIQCGARIVDDLKATLPIGMDILGPEQIDLVLSQSLLTIGSCQGVRVLINIRTKRRRTRETDRSSEDTNDHAPEIRRIRTNHHSRYETLANESRLSPQSSGSQQYGNWRGSQRQYHGRQYRIRCGEEYYGSIRHGYAEAAIRGRGRVYRGRVLSHRYRRRHARTNRRSRIVDKEATDAQRYREGACGASRRTS
jgi:hypothetical protein